MNPIFCQLATVAVATLYCTWRRHQFSLIQQERLLRERVAWMLWVMAQHTKQHEPTANVS